MKAKITLTLLTCFVLASCTKWRWHNHHNDNKVQLTEDNYVFEGDLYEYALSFEIVALEEKITELQEIIDNNQGTPEIEEELELAKQELDEKAAISEGLLTSADIAGRIGPRTPAPPPPPPPILPPELRYAVMYELVALDIMILDANGELIAQTIGDIRTLSGTRGRLQYKEFEVLNPEYEGSVLVQVQRVDEEGRQAEYEFEASKTLGN